ncbi:MAG: hypothetical protein WC641_08150 [Patescibacteria group bacterium]
MSSDFGKDMGLVHDVVVLARGVGGGKEFWKVLSEKKNLDLLRRFVAETEEYAELKKEYEQLKAWGVDLSKPISEDLAPAHEFLAELVRMMPDHWNKNDFCCCDTCVLKFISGSKALSFWNGEGGLVGFRQARLSAWNGILTKLGYEPREVNLLSFRYSRHLIIARLETVAYRRKRIVELFCK